MPQSISKDLSESDYDELIFNYLEEYSLLLSFFRLFQSSFERIISFSDLDNLLALITDDNIHTLGPYWELRFLTAISYWKASLGLVFDVVDNLVRLKNLNSLASNFLVDSQIFHIEALIAFKSNSPDSLELLQSALFLATEYNFLYQTIDVLLTKAEIDPDHFFDTINQAFTLADVNIHPLIHAKLYALLGAHYIQEKKWTEAEKNLLQSSKLVQGSYDKKTYYQVVADFSYVLVVTRQLQDALESSIVLLDDNVSVLYRIRGFYLYGLTLLLLDQKSESIEIIEEGIRIALTHKEHISLPWFYEILNLIYLSLNDFENASRYGNLTYKAYFDSSDSDAGHRSKLVNTFLLCLENDYGRALNQITGLLYEVPSELIQYESYSALLTVLLGSQESLELNKFNDIWDAIKELDSVSLIRTLIDTKYGKNFIGLCPFHQEKTPSFPEIKQVENYLNQEDLKDFTVGIELVLLVITTRQEDIYTVDEILKLLEIIERELMSLKIKFTSLDIGLEKIRIITKVLIQQKCFFR